MFYCKLFATKLQGTEIFNKMSDFAKQKMELNLEINVTEVGICDKLES